MNTISGKIDIRPPSHHIFIGNQSCESEPVSSANTDKLFYNQALQMVSLSPAKPNGQVGPLPF